MDDDIGRALPRLWKKAKEDCFLARWQTLFNQNGSITIFAAFPNRGNRNKCGQEQHQDAR
jgi:hypothetical protein